MNTISKSAEMKVGKVYRPLTGNSGEPIDNATAWRVVKFDSEGKVYGTSPNARPGACPIPLDMSRAWVEVPLELARMTLSRAAILDTARQAVTKDRAATHGDLEDNFSAVAQIWSTRLGRTIASEQVAIMMIDLKTVRAWGNPAHEDNWVDMAGYAACGGELANGAS